jgi:hypothetical protein
MNVSSSRQTENALAHGTGGVVLELLLELELEPDADADTPLPRTIDSKSLRSGANPSKYTLRIHVDNHVRNDGELRCVGW